MNVTVILSTYKRPDMLYRTLKSFCDLDRDGLSWELIVVDNAEDPATRRVVKKYDKQLPLRFIIETKPGKNSALNRAIPCARGNILAFTDDDVILDPAWLREVINATERWPCIRVFGGRVEPIFPCQVSDKIKNASFSGYVFARYHPYTEERICIDTSPVGPNCWFRREIFDEGFRYDSTIGPKGKGRVSGSELEFFVRLSNAGEKIVYVPSAVVYHRIQKYQLTLPYLLKRAYGGGRGWVRIYDPWRDSRKLGGIPVFLIKKVMEEFLTSFVYLVKGKNHLEPLMQLCQCVGAIAEYRASHLERKRSPRRYSEQRSDLRR